MLRLFVAVEAKPGNEDLTFPGAEGYYQTFGVTAHDESEIPVLLQDYPHKDLASTLVAISDRWPPDFEGADADLRDVVGDTSSRGIWYSSGRAWFGPED
jgi:hypothetical protein